MGKKKCKWDELPLKERLKKRAKQMGLVNILNELDKIDVMKESQEEK